MIVLDATTKSLEIVLGGAVTTNQLPFVASYVDVTTTVYTPAENDGTSNNTTAVTIVAAPAASTQRQVKFISIQNADTASATVTVRYNNNATTRTIVRVALTTGYHLVYTDGEGWRVYDTTGSLVSASSGSAPNSAVYIVGAAHADLTAERVITDSTSITWDTTVAGQVEVRRAALTGDVTASANANATTIAANAVLNTMIRDSGALSVIGRSANITGDPADISATAATDAVLRESGSTIGFGTVATAGIANNAITDTKIRDSGALSVVGRSANTTGDPADISATATSAAVLRESGSTIGFGTVATAGIADNAITYVKMQDIVTDSLIGRDTAATGDPETIGLNATLSMDGAGNLQRAALTGDVTASAGSNTTTIANDAVTYAKMQNVSATDRILGRDTAGAGDTEELVADGGLEFSGTPGIRTATSVNAQSGITYTVVTGDRSKLVTHTNAAAIAVTLPQATGDFGAGWYYWTENRGAGTVTITPTTSTVDGAATLALTTDQGCLITSDGTNYFTMRGVGGGSGTPGGVDTQVQFNDATAFGGDAGLTYNKTTDALTIAGQLIISGASAGQIVFPATQNASTNANTLDDYEEGTWTPVIGGETSQTGQTYSLQVGSYIKIGRFVAVGGNVTLSAAGTITGDIVVRGLPFTSENVASQQSGGALSYFASLAVSWIALTLTVPPNQAFAYVRGTKAAVATVPSLAPADIGNSTQFIFAAIYPAA